MYLKTLHYQYVIPYFPEMQNLYSWKKKKKKSQRCQQSLVPKPDDVFHEICDLEVCVPASFHLCRCLLCVSDGTEVGYS